MWIGKIILSMVNLFAPAEALNSWLAFPSFPSQYGRRRLFVKPQTEFFMGFHRGLDASICDAKRRTILVRSTVGASENCFHKFARGKIGVSFDVVNDASRCDVDHASTGDKDVFL